MIYDEITRFKDYAAIHRLFSDAVRFLETDYSSLTPGKHPIGANGMYAAVNEYTTKPVSSCVIECHRAFIDIQMVISGMEKIGLAPLTASTEKTVYDPKRDFAELSGLVDFLTLTPGMFVILFPYDGHMPGVTIDHPVTVKKIVLKVPV
jgi:biofilm protein TabA